MKNFKNITTSTLIASLFVGGLLSSGCQKNVEPVEPIVPTQTKLTFTAGIDGAGAAQTLASGIRDTEFKPSDTIGIYVVAYSKPGVAGKWEADGNYVDNAAGIKGAGVGTAEDWTIDPVIYYPTVKVDMYSYAPYNKSFKPTKPEAHQFTVAADQSTAIKVAANDFMTAKVIDLGASANKIPMTFFHRLSKVDVKFTLPKTYKGKNVAALNSIQFKGFHQTSTIDMLADYTYDKDGVEKSDGTGTFPKPATVVAASKVVDITPNAVTAAAVTDPATVAHYEAIVVPQTLAGNFGLIEIEIDYTDGGTEKFYYVTASAGIEFKAARSTVINLSFGDNSPILLGTVDIQGWTVVEVPSIPINKPSNMNIKCVAGTDTIITNAVSAVLTIEGADFVGTAKYNATVGSESYHIQYDHGGNFGGYLSKIILKKADGTPVITAVPSAPLQIKGDPTTDSYSKIIGKLTFDTGAVTFGPNI